MSIPALNPLERPGTHYTGGWVGPRTGLGRCGKSHPLPGFDPRFVQPVASRYADWATRPTFNIHNKINFRFSVAIMYVMEFRYINANFLLANYVIKLTNKQRRSLDWIRSDTLPLLILAVFFLHRYCFDWYFLRAAIIHINTVMFHNPYLLHASRV
jgi:hypothetical protein